MGDEKNKGQECCTPSGSGCCCGKKFLVGVIVGVILAAAAIGIFAGSKCSMMGGSGRMCPVMQMQVK